jgi:magnesium-transporting ATPase (P-type)
MQQMTTGPSNHGHSTNYLDDFLISHLQMHPSTEPASNEFNLCMLSQATVEFTGKNTFFGKTASLLQDTHEHSHLQKILLAIMFVLVSLPVTLCLISLIYLLVEGVDLKDAISHTIVLLVASIPPCNRDRHI